MSETELIFGYNYNAVSIKTMNGIKVFLENFSDIGEDDLEQTKRHTCNLFGGSVQAVNIL